MQVVHLTARLRDSACARLDRAHAAWLWARVREAFPNVVAATLMPNHLHVVAVVENLDRAHATFVKILAAFARHIRATPPLWQPVPKPQIVPPHKVLRSIRYAALNPPRKRLVRDPLAWYWSTYRDVVGAVADPWVTLDGVRCHLPAGMRDVQRLHAYVSGDPSVHVAGTPPPFPAADVEIQERPLLEILTAAAAATRGSMQDHRRRGPTRTTFVWLAVRQGWRDMQRLADLCGITRQGIAKILRGEPPPSLAAAQLCLGDRRLLWSVGGPAPVEARSFPDGNLAIAQSSVEPSRFQLGNFEATQPSREAQLARGPAR
jgi:transcriptional regulator with XRE-family HTH domain